VAPTGYVRRPAFERLLALIHKLAAVIGAGDAAKRAADMIDGDFNDVRQHACSTMPVTKVARLVASISCGRTTTMTSTFYSTVSRQGETKRIAFGHDVAAEPNIRTLKRGGAERLESVRMFR
jgi:hypothetical protein